MPACHQQVPEPSRLEHRASERVLRACARGIEFRPKIKPAFSRPFTAPAHFRGEEFRLRAGYTIQDLRYEGPRLLEVLAQLFDAGLTGPPENLVDAASGRIVQLPGQTFEFGIEIRDDPVDYVALDALYHLVGNPAVEGFAEPFAQRLRIVSQNPERVVHEAGDQVRGGGTDVLYRCFQRRLFRIEPDQVGKGIAQRLRLTVLLAVFARCAEQLVDVFTNAGLDQCAGFQPGFRPAEELLCRFVDSPQRFGELLRRLHQPGRARRQDRAQSDGVRNPELEARRELQARTGGHGKSVSCRGQGNRVPEAARQARLASQDQPDIAILRR